MHYEFSKKKKTFRLTETFIKYFKHASVEIVNF